MRKGVKALITNCHCHGNRSFEENLGGEAVMIGLLVALRTAIPNIEIRTPCQFSDEFADRHSIEVIHQKAFKYKSFSPASSLASCINLCRSFLWHLVRKHMRLDAGFLVSWGRLRYYHEADIIIDASMDLYSDDFGLLSVVEHSKDILCGAWLGKPVVLCAQSIGPFRGRLGSRLARFAMRRVHLITAREETTYEYLAHFGLAGVLLQHTSDPAFLLKPAPDDEVKRFFEYQHPEGEERPLVGMTISGQSPVLAKKGKGSLSKMTRLYELVQYLLPECVFVALLGVARRTGAYAQSRAQYTKTVEETVRIIDYLTTKYQATVVLLPHVTAEGLVYNDRAISQEVLDRASQKANVRLITGDYTAAVVKGVIGKCDMFVGMKMHASIAALSQGVPTLAIAYSYKFQGIMRQLGQEGRVLSPSSETDMKKAIDEIWTERNGIRHVLESIMPSIREQSLRNGQLIGQLLDKRLDQPASSSHLRANLNQLAS